MPSAQRAFQQGNTAALERIRGELQESPLRIWVDHWLLRLELQSDTSTDLTRKLAAFDKAWGPHPLARRNWALWAEAQLRSRLESGKPIDDVLGRLDPAVESTALRCARAAPSDQATLEAGLSDRICRDLLVQRSTGWSLSADERTRLARSLAFARQTKSAIDLWSAAPAGGPGLTGSEERFLGWLAELSKSLKEAERLHQRGLRLSPEQSKAAEFALGARGWLRSDADASRRIRRHLAQASTMPAELVESAARQMLRDNAADEVLRLISAMPARMQADEPWRYWRARIGMHKAAARGESTDPFKEELSALSSGLSFYSVLAAESLGRNSEVEVLAAPAPAGKAKPRALTAELKALRKDPSVRRALAMARVGLRSESAIEWRGVIENRTDAELVALATLAMAAQAPDRAVIAAARSDDPAASRLRFPTPFGGPLREALEALNPQHIGPAWVYGIVRQESRFLVDVKSSANAQGLMQLIPPTARATARKAGLGRFQLADLADPGTNLRLGTHYLEELARRFEGNRVLATAGYNAGPHRSITWRARLSEPVDGAAFVESIPFKETRDYVKAVSLNAVVYERLLSGATSTRTPLTQWLGEISPGPAGGGSEIADSSD